MSDRDRPKVVVLGGTGLLGTKVRRLFEQQEVDLRVVGRRATAPAVPRSVADVEIRYADLAVDGAVEECVAGADVIVHLAAYNDRTHSWRVAETDPRAWDLNVGVLHRVVAAAAGAARPPVVVFTGSVSQAAASGEVVRADSPDHPRTVYDRQKCAAEAHLLEAQRKGVVRGLSLRLSTLVADDQESFDLDTGVMATMVRRAWAGDPLTLWHDGTVVRDLIGVSDAARAVVAGVEAIDSLEGRRWAVGSGTSATVLELFRAIAEEVGRSTGRAPVPIEVLTPPASSVETDRVDMRVDPSEFAEITGWSPRTPWRQALVGVASRPQE